MLTVSRAVTAALLVALTAAAQPAAQTAAAGPAPSRGRTLTYAASADVDNLDPAQRGGTISGAVKELVYGSLVDVTPAREIRPDLATS